MFSPLYINNYLFLGLIQRPLSTSEMRTNAIAIQLKTVLSVAIPMVKKAMPRMRNMPDDLRLFRFIDCLFPSCNLCLAGV